MDVIQRRRRGKLLVESFKSKFQERVQKNLNSNQMLTNKVMSTQKMHKANENALAASTKASAPTTTRTTTITALPTSAKKIKITKKQRNKKQLQLHFVSVASTNEQRVRSKPPQQCH